VWSLASGVLWLFGALNGAGDRMAWWGPALAIDLIGPAVGYWLPGRGRAGTEEWAIDGGHFAERFQAFIIIALGESIGVTGLTASAGSLRGDALVALALAFWQIGALWWLYFGEVAEHSRRELSDAKDPGRLARDAYTYLHLPIVAGIIMVAVAGHFLIARPDRIAGGPVSVMLIGGPAMYLAGESLFRLRMIGSVSAKRVGAVVALCGLGAVAHLVSALVLASCVTAVLSGLAISEYEPLKRRLQGEAAAAAAV
jgi:low temperature requirement protein LtrA